MTGVAYAIVRDGRYFIAAGDSLSEALTRAGQTFYSGKVPPNLQILEYGSDPLPALAAIPCSSGVLSLENSLFGGGALVLYEGRVWLEDELGEVCEEQLPLF